MKESLIRPIVAQTLDLPESLVGVTCDLNTTIIVVSHEHTMTEADRQRVQQALHAALDTAFVTLGLIRFL